MIKYFTALFIALAPAANAQQMGPTPVQLIELLTPVSCAFNGLGYMSNLAIEYDEKPLFTSKTTSVIIGEQAVRLEGTLVVMTNQNTGTVTVMVVYGDGSTCMLAEGTEFTPM